MTKPKTYVSAYAGGKRVGDLPKLDVPEEIRRRWISDNAEAELDRLLDMETPEKDRDISQAVFRDLAERGIREPTQEELLAALERQGAR
jgi:hypothetical protein